MTIIKIIPHDNGGHDNQTIHGGTLENFPFPEGWAIIPESVGTPGTLENYPFGEVAVEDIDGAPTVTGWSPLPVPEPEPVEMEEPTQLDRLEAQATYTAMMTDTLLEV